jgi:hypothetical protein
VASWRDVADSAPEFAQRVQAVFDAHRHKTLATVRQDGSPRISGIEATFADGELWFGSMAGSRKTNDLKRDPRLALHSASEEPPAEARPSRGDAKLSGRAVEVRDPARLNALGGEGSGDLFRIEIAEVVLTRVGDPPDHLVIELWREGEGLRQIIRR